MSIYTDDSGGAGELHRSCRRIRWQKNDQLWARQIKPSRKSDKKKKMTKEVKFTGRHKPCRGCSGQTRTKRSVLAIAEKAKYIAFLQRRVVESCCSAAFSPLQIEKLIRVGVKKDGTKSRTILQREPNPGVEIHLPAREQLQTCSRIYYGMV